VVLRTSGAIAFVATVGGLSDVVWATGLVAGAPLLLAAGILGLGSLAARSERWREVSAPTTARDR
jgi:hypothetical protein